jgi:putative hemolysin
VPTISPALDVLKVLQRRRTQIAIVVDEHGAVVGLVTVEDLVEELVGDIFSEHEPERIRRQADGSALVMGTTTIRDINRELGTSLPEGTQWTSLAGLVIAKMGWIPPIGATVTLDDGTTLEVVEGTSRRVTTVRVRAGGAAVALPRSP